MTKTRRRLRWALLIALALHLLLAWRLAPGLREQLTQVIAPDEKILDIAPAPPEETPPGEKLALRWNLHAGSPEALPAELPEDFFPKLAPARGGRLALAGSLSATAPDPPPASAGPPPALAADAIPSVIKLPDIVAISPNPRTPAPSAAAPAKPMKSKPAKPAPAKQAPITAAVIAEKPRPLPPVFSAPTAPAPSAAPNVQDDLAREAQLDSAISRATETAERTVRASAPAPRPREDLRALLPAGPMVAASPLPSATAVPAPAPAANGSRVISTFPLDAPAAADLTRAAPDRGPGEFTPNRQQYFARLTAQLKAANQRALAESVKAGSRVEVRVKFWVDRGGRVLDVQPGEGAASAAGSAAFAAAAAVVRAASPFPRIPDAMTQQRLELSFPVEVYR